MSSTAATTFRTFRDPAGSLKIEGERVLRTVHPAHAADVRNFLASQLADTLVDTGKLIATQILDDDEEGLCLEHPRIFFPSYPWEWSEAQWIDAALLTLDLCDQLIDHDLILKDATPLNILFDGTRPVLVDLLSIDRRTPGDPIWKAYGQFVRTFVLPLAAHQALGWPLTVSRARRDGYEPDDIYPHLSFFRRWFGPCRDFVTLPVLLDRIKKKDVVTAPSMRFSDDACAAILHARLRGLRRVILGLASPKSRSRWSGYVSHRNHYASQDSQRKASFIQQALATIRPTSVLDIGANTGEFSRMAAQAGARVVALDTDLLSTELHYKRAHRKRDSILPLHADIARPTPSAGWKNLESLGLLARCRHRFDCILMLGLLHHLLVSDQIPLDEIARLVAELAPRALLIEWIPPSDTMFQQICRGRDDLYGTLSEEDLVRSFSPFFITVTRTPLDNGRILFHLEAR